MANLINDTKMQVLTVFLGEQSFGIPISKIQDVLKPLALTTVPLAESYIEGICNLRGRIVTAVNLRKRLQEAAAQTGEAMNVVIESNNELYSILVDRVGDVLTLDPAGIEDPLITLNTGWGEVSRGMYQLDDNIMIILDAEKVIHAL